MRALLVRNVRAFDPHPGLDAVVDVFVENGVITRLGADAGREVASSERVTVIDGTGLWLLPGFVDLHAHVREPGQEYKEDVRSALRAAAAGGFVDICAMPNTKPVNDTRAVTEMLVYKARSIGGTRLHPIGAITMGLGGEHLTEMADQRDAGCVGVSDDGRCVVKSGVMRRAFEYASTFDLPVIQHAEDHDLTDGAQMHEGVVATKLGLRGWPRVAEDIIVARDLMLAEYTGGRYHLAHASTKGSVELVRAAKERGIKVSAEVTPHHLLLTHEALLGYDTACKVNPPLRESGDVEALRQGLADGTIDCVATDHAPHSYLEKDVPFADASPGMVGLELCFPVLLDLVRQGCFSLARLVDALTRSPSRIVALPSPTLREGAKANFVLVDPERKWTIDPARFESKSRNTPFAGREVKGRILATYVDGLAAFELPKEGTQS
jgi:dihydroorotase